MTIILDEKRPDSDICCVLIAQTALQNNTVMAYASEPLTSITENLLQELTITQRTSDNTLMNHAGKSSTGTRRTTDSTVMNHAGESSTSAQRTTDTTVMDHAGKSSTYPANQ